MHTYSIDSNERKIIILTMASISIVLAWISSRVLNDWKIVLPWWSESPSVLFYFGLLYFLFDSYVWKHVRKIGFIKTPNLSGNWKGYLTTSFNGNASKIKATLRIFQTWTVMKIILTTDQSSSYSESASIVTAAPEGEYLSYQYFNEPGSNAQRTMNIHRGTAKLLFDKKHNTLSGEYYSGRGRQNFGTISFKRGGGSRNFK